MRQQWGSSAISLLASIWRDAADLGFAARGIPCHNHPHPNPPSSTHRRPAALQGSSSPWAAASPPPDAQAAHNRALGMSFGEAGAMAVCRDFEGVAVGYLQSLLRFECGLYWLICSTHGHREGFSVNEANR